jgi:AraC-like DNA-binding protein
MEMIYFSGGSYLVEINMESYPVTGECFYFIHPGELHQITAVGTNNAVEGSAVFNLELLHFTNMDEAQLEILVPLNDRSLALPRCLTPDQQVFRPIRNAFARIFESMDLNLWHLDTDFQEKSAQNAAQQLLIKSMLLSILAELSLENLLVPALPSFDRRIESIKIALSYIEENYTDKIYIRDLADLVGMNEQYFCRFFRRAMGRSPMEFLNEYRIRKAQQLLKETDLPVTEVCLESGFNNPGNFLKEFRKYSQTTPSRYRKAFQDPPPR